MRKLHYTLAILFLAVFAACETNTTKDDSKDIAEDHNEAKYNESSKEDDAQFLVNAAEFNMIQAKIGILAQANTKNTDVISLATMMQETHRSSMDKLSALAQSKQITLPATESDNTLKVNEDMKSKNGASFDKAYADFVVNGHKQAIESFEKTINETSDVEIKAWAEATIVDLRAHLDQAMIILNAVESK
jgi:putative membrane protein